jgi:hypothetical protein
MATLNPISHSFNYSQRREEVLQKIRFFEKEMGISRPVTLGIRAFHKSACVDLNQRIIEVPFWFLFRPEDVPEQFRIRTLNDPRLTDNHFLNQMAGWINGKIQEAGLTSICRPTDLGTLQLFSNLLRDPEKYAQSRDFIIGHEVAHLSHEQATGVAEMISIAQDSIAAFGVIAPLFALVLIFGFTPLISVGFALTAAGIAFTISATSLVIWLTQKKSAPSLSDVEQEKKADLDSAKVLRNAQGGIYYFDAVRMHQLRIRHRNSANTSIDELGNNLGDKKHPPVTERLAYLNQWQLEHNLQHQRA